jgi:hypothetical protein
MNFELQFLRLPHEIVIVFNKHEASIKKHK